LFLAVLAAYPVLGGCSGLLDLLPGIPGFNTIVVEVVSDSAFEVDPRIRFSEDTGFFAGLFGGQDLATGTLLPGDILTFDFDCDALGMIRSESAGQFLGAETIGQADVTRVLEFDQDFQCGDVITFTFLGEGPTFGVVVSVNGRVVD
jgi:hypothetical protein